MGKSKSEDNSDVKIPSSPITSYLHSFIILMLLQTQTEIYERNSDLHFTQII